MLQKNLEGCSAAQFSCRLFSRGKLASFVVNGDILEERSFSSKTAIDPGRQSTTGDLVVRLHYRAFLETGMAAGKSRNGFFFGLFLVTDCSFSHVGLWNKGGPLSSPKERDLTGIRAQIDPSSQGETALFLASPGKLITKLSCKVWASFKNLTGLFMLLGPSSVHDSGCRD